MKKFLDSINFLGMNLYSSRLIQGYVWSSLLIPKEFRFCSNDEVCYDS